MSYNLLTQDLVSGFKKGFHLKVEENRLKYVRNKKSCCNSKNALREIREETAAISFAIQQLSSGACFQKDPSAISLYTALSNKQKSINSMVTGFKGLFCGKSRKKELNLLNSELKKLKTLFVQQALTSVTSERILSLRGSSEKSLEDILKRELPLIFKDIPSAKDFENSPFFISENRSGYIVYCAPLNQNSHLESIPINRIADLPAALQRYRARKMMQEEFSAYFNQPKLNLNSEQVCRMAVGRVDLFYQEGADLGKNTLIIEYYNPLKGKEKLEVNLNDFNHDQISALIRDCQGESVSSLALMDNRARALEEKLKFFDLKVKYNLISKKFEIFTSDKFLSMSIEKFEIGQFNEYEMKNLYNLIFKKFEPYHFILENCFHEEINKGTAPRDLNKFSLKLNLLEQKIELFSYDYEKKCLEIKKFDLKENVSTEIIKFCLDKTQMHQTYFYSLAERARVLEEKLKVFGIKVEYCTYTKTFSFSSGKDPFYKPISFTENEIEILESPQFHQSLVMLFNEKCYCSYIELFNENFLLNTNYKNNQFAIKIDLNSRKVELYHFNLFQNRLEKKVFKLKLYTFSEIKMYCEEQIENNKQEEARIKLEQANQAKELKIKKELEQVSKKAEDAGSSERCRQVNYDLLQTETKSLEEFIAKIRKFKIDELNFEKTGEVFLEIIPPNATCQEIVDCLFEECSRGTDFTCLLYAVFTKYPEFKLSPYDTIRLMIIGNDDKLTNEFFISFIKEHKLDERQVLACYDLANLLNNPRIYPIKEKA